MTGSPDRLNVVDQPTYLEDLTEVPQKVSGTLKPVTFVDSDLLPYSEGYILINPEFIDSTGRTRKLDTNPHKRRWFVATDRSALSTRHWVCLEDLLSRINHLSREQGKEKPLEISIDFKP